MKSYLEQIELAEVKLAYLRFLEHKDRFPNPNPSIDSEISFKFIDKIMELEK